jgi:hypothetical protein
MDIEGKWVHFEDSLELEIFLNACEEQGVWWRKVNGFKPRYFLQTDLDDFKREQDKPIYRCGYYVCKGLLYDMSYNEGKYMLSLNISETPISGQDAPEDSPEYYRFRL